MKFVTSRLLDGHGIEHGFSDQTGFGYKIDDNESISQRELEKWFSGFSSAKIALLDLQNGKAVRKLEKADGSLTVLKADAAVSNLPVALTLTVADCIPILIYDQALGSIGIVHAGWRGLTGGIIENTLQTMFESGSKADDVLVAMGPAICGRCYEFGPEAPELFPASVLKPKGDKYLVDLKAYAKQKFNNLAVEQIDDVKVCVYENSAYGAFRRDHTLNRNLAFIRKEQLINA